MEHITLFTDILPEEQERMRVCFKVREKVFQKDLVNDIVQSAESRMKGKQERSGTCLGGN